MSCVRGYTIRIEPNLDKAGPGGWSVKVYRDEQEPPINLKPSIDLNGAAFFAARAVLRDVEHGVVAAVRHQMRELKARMDADMESKQLHAEALREAKHEC